jgi:hypothetical protein
MNALRILPQAVCLLILLPLAQDARADEVPDLRRALLQLDDLARQQGEINGQLKKAEDALINDILADKRVDEKASKARAAHKDELAAKEEQLARRLDEAARQMLALQQRLDRSDAPADREKAALLRAALKFSADRSLPDRFKKLTTAMQTGSFENLETIQQARTGGEALRKDLQDLSTILLQEGRDTELEQALRESKKDLDAVRQLAEGQKALHDRATRGDATADQLLKVQAMLTEATRTLARDPNRIWGRGLRDAVADQEKAEQALKDGKLADAAAHQMRALGELESATKKAALLVTQLEEEIADRAAKKPR